MEAALLDTIAASPEDDLPRLVYADWLEDRGDTDRAAFIRTHIALARARPGSADAVRLAAAAGNLFRPNAAAWCVGLGRPAAEDLRPGRRRGLFTRERWPTLFDSAAHRRGGSYEFDVLWPRCVFTVRRGLIDDVNVLCQPADLSAHPVAALRLILFRGAAPDRWFDPRVLGRVRVLNLGTHDGPDGTDELAASPHWRNLRALDIDGVHAPAVVRAVARSPLARRVRVLRVSSEPNAALDAVMGWPGDAGLEELCASFTWHAYGVPDAQAPASLAALAPSPVGRMLRRLSIDSGTHVLDLRPLAAGPVWPSLTALRVHGFRYFSDSLGGFSALARSGSFPRVADLRFPATGFGDDAAVALAESAWPGRLRNLDLRHTAVTIYGLNPLAEALRDGPLERLDVRGCALAPDDKNLLRDVLGDRVRV